MQVKIEKSWAEHLQQEFDAPYFEALTQFVKAEYAAGPCYPPAGQIFRAFDACPFDQVKVVILGQDPYHEPGQAEGLCFSVPEGVPYPPSLQNIYKEILSDCGQPHGISTWPQQGVLLLNSTLTVRAHQAASHAGRGWEQFTDAAIRALATERENLVFILWGAYAQKKGAFIDRQRHLVLQSAHPSPLSAYRGFFGNHHFTLANDYLKQHNLNPILW
ncbi:MAG: uracil-DNA glycosylase [Bacteroidaceae bacterium]|nr:uracil-DNA glycosylase [Bacteroidaceae bacterium]